MDEELGITPEDAEMDLRNYMTKCAIAIAIGGALVYGSWSLAWGQGGATSTESPRFRKKQFVYGAEKWGLRILEAVITLEEVQSGEGEKAYVARAQVDTTGVTSVFFSMHNRFHSWVDADHFGPLRYLKEIHQNGIFSGEKRYTSILNFVPGENRVVVDGEKEINLPPDTQDPLSFFVKYYLEEEIKAGQEIHMSIYDGIRLREVTFMARGESIETSLCGRVEVICLESKVPFSSLGGREGIIKIWFTRDRRKVPARIGLELPIGTVHFDLESFEEG